MYIQIEYLKKCRGIALELLLSVLQLSNSFYTSVSPAQELLTTETFFVVPSEKVKIESY